MANPSSGHISTTIIRPDGRRDVATEPCIGLKTPGEHHIVPKPCPSTPTTSPLPEHLSTRVPGTLDSSTMTSLDDVINECDADAVGSGRGDDDGEQFDAVVERLAALFAGVTREDVAEVLTLCGGDADWAATMLLDASADASDSALTLADTACDANADTAQVIDHIDKLVISDSASNSDLLASGGGESVEGHSPAKSDCVSYVDGRVSNTDESGSGSGNETVTLCAGSDGITQLFHNYPCSSDEASIESLADVSSGKVLGGSLARSEFVGSQSQTDLVSGNNGSQLKSTIPSAQTGVDSSLDSALNPTACTSTYIPQDLYIPAYGFEYSPDSFAAAPFSSASSEVFTSENAWSSGVDFVPSYHPFAPGAIHGGESVDGSGGSIISWSLTHQPWTGTCGSTPYSETGCPVQTSDTADSLRQHAEVSVPPGEGGVSSPVHDYASRLQLQLSPLLLYQLQQLFCPADEPHLSLEELFSMPEHLLSVQLSAELAHQLYSVWRQTGQAESWAADCAINAADNADSVKDEPSSMNPSRSSPSPGRNRGRIFTGRRPDQPLLSDIIEDQLAQRFTGETRDSLSDRLSLQRLQSEFPNVTADFLSQLYNTHNGNYDTLRQLLCDSFGAPVRASVTVADATPTTTTSTSGGVCERSEADVVGWRAEIVSCRQHLRTMRQVMQSNAALRSPQVFSQYARQVARLHGRIRECELRIWLKAASVSPLSTLSDSLDLHHLSVPASVAILAEYIVLQQRAVLLRGISRKKVHVVTGYGVHSTRGFGRLKAAVVNWLKAKRIRFDETLDNPGMLIVSVRDC